MTISLIMPCYNEEEGLKFIFESMPCFIDEVIIVDNGSQDNSIQIAKNYNATLLIEKIKGYGSAILTGLRHANGKIIAIADSDGSYLMESLKYISKYMLDENLDFVSGCRFPLTDFEIMPFLNKICNYFISWLIRFLFKIKIIDSQSGMMVFKNDILMKIKLQNQGMGFSQEFKIKTWLNPYIKCGEFHIPYHSRLGRVKFNKIKDGIRNLYDVLILWQEERKGKHY